MQNGEEAGKTTQSRPTAPTWLVTVAPSLPARDEWGESWRENALNRLALWTHKPTPHPPSAPSPPLRGRGKGRGGRGPVLE